MKAQELIKQVREAKKESLRKDIAEIKALLDRKTIKEKRT